ncbi:MAG: chromosomal replication initiator protein DnaA, partial [Deltaproteobacteria bacterium]|nr:chromosomal replication initiator protein DnaA [Deltaproteobacteria bacterium]
METAWAQTVSLLRQRLEPGPFKVWIASLVGRVDGAECVVHAVSSFAAGFVRDNFLPQIREALRDALGREIAVRVTGEPLPPPVPGAAADASNLPLAGGAAVPSAEVPPLVATSREAGNAPARPLIVGPSASWRPSAELCADGQHPLPLRYADAAFKMTVRSWRHSFDDFVVGPCNELAFAASRSMCKGRGGAGILFLSSATGLGKTHLIQAA